MACTWLGNPWICICWLVLLRWCAAGRASGLDGELRGLALIVFFAGLVGNARM